MSLDNRCLREEFTEQRGHQLFHFWTHTTTIKIDGIGEIGGKYGRTTQFLHIGIGPHATHKLLADDLNNLLTRLMDGVNALSSEDYGLMTGCDNRPIGLSASTICN